MDVLLSIGFWKFAAPFFGAIFAWIANERRKRYWELYKRKEENYKQLLNTVRGFYDGLVDEKFMSEFLHQMNLCWLYCPDEVIQKGYDFLHLIRDDVKATDKERNRHWVNLYLQFEKIFTPKRKLIGSQISELELQQRRIFQVMILKSLK